MPRNGAARFLRRMPSPAVCRAKLPGLKRRLLLPEIYAGGPAEAPAGDLWWEISNLRQ